MSRIPEEIVNKIIDRSKIEDFVSQTTRHGNRDYIECPECHASGTKNKKPQGVLLTYKKGIGKCFQCGFGFKDALGYLMKVKKLEYIDAIKEMAQHYSIDIEPDDNRQERLKAEGQQLKAKSQKPAAKPKNQKLKAAKRAEKQRTFCDQQLEESGLTIDDVKTTMYRDDKTEINRQAFRRGMRDNYGKFYESKGDDMLIEYLDLDGNPVMYKKPKSETYLPLLRVRYQNPELHKDREGRPMKYQSPPGSGSHIYIPEKIRYKYKHSRTIETLFIQEGEKKAEKSCKHGVPSIGIMGIQNLGYKDQLPPELSLLIQRCKVQRVVFLLDSDWNNLSGSIRNGDNIEQRPRSFFYAVRNYKDYMRSLLNGGISIDIYFGHIRPNEKNDKGIDDLLVNTLKGNEELLKQDIEEAINAKSGEGGLVNIYKITMMSDSMLADKWFLNDAEKFITHHREELKELKEFKVGKIIWTFNDAGSPVMAQQLLPNEQYWEEIPKNNGSIQLNFDYVNCMNFLQNRGYFKYRMKSGDFEFIHIENKVVERVNQWDIKDFVKDYTAELKRKDVSNMLMRGGPQYLGHEKLSNLHFAAPVIERATKNTQCLYFKDCMWEISANGIKELPYNQMKNHVWKENIIDFKAKVLPPMVEVKQITEEMIIKEPQAGLVVGEYLVKVTNEGKRGDFLNFLFNASNFTWRKKEKGEHISVEEKLQNNRHFINKLTAMGFLLHDYMNPSELRAVISMDGKLSEVGQSNGRTGKSLLGNAISYVIPQVCIGGKNKRLTEDQFIFGEVTEKTRNLFLDDVRANMDFEFFFPIITGMIKINPKGSLPYTLTGRDVPKLLLSTNHAINGNDTSTRDRQALVAFSDFYNDRRKPADVSGRNFFGDDWGEDQWNLFYNLMANCLVLYFQALEKGWGDRPGRGIIPPPLENLELRRLRQAVGEDMLAWADAYFAPPSESNEIEAERLNDRLVRKTLYDDFLENNPHARKYVTPSGFGRRMKDFCRYKGYHLNPQKPNENGVGFIEWREKTEGEIFIGEADKSGGVEYFTIADNNWRDKGTT